MLGRLFGRKQESAPEKPVAPSPPVPADWPWKLRPGEAGWFVAVAKDRVQTAICPKCDGYTCTPTGEYCYFCRCSGAVHPLSEMPPKWSAVPGKVTDIRWDCDHPPALRFVPSDGLQQRRFVLRDDIPADRVFLTEPEAQACADRLNAEAAAKEAK